MDDPAAAVPIHPSLTLAPLTRRQSRVLTELRAHLPAQWLASRRRRRLFFLALAAPGFLAVFATPLHGQFLIMASGFVLFGAAVLFRVLTEPLFARAAAAAPSPAPPSSAPVSKDSRHG
jgi:hypothetical protein